MEIPRYQRSVAAVGPARAPRLRPSAAGGMFGAAAQGLETVAGILAHQEEAEAVAFASKVSAEAARHFSIRSRQAKAEATEGAAGFAGAFDVEVDTYAKDILARAPNETARELASARLGKLQESLFEDAVDFEAKATHRQRLTDFDLGVKALSTAAFNDPGGAARYLAQAEGDLKAASSVWMLPQDASERRAKLAEGIAGAAIKGLIAADPAAAVAALDQGVFDPGLDGDAKAALRKSATEALGAVERERKAAAKEAERLAKQAEKERREALQNDYLTRLNDPQAPVPTVREVLASELPPAGAGSKKAFIDLIEKKRSGSDLNVTDPRVYRARRAAIAGGLLRGPEALIPDIGNGLGITDFERLKSDMARAATDRGKADLTLRGRAIDLAKRELVNSKPLLGINDPEGERRLYALEFELDQKLAEGEQAGKTYENMLNPRSPDYVLGPLIQTYRQTPAEVLNSQVRALENMAPAADKGLARLPGETIQQWRERTGK